MKGESRWMRLDPTPGASIIDEADKQGVERMLNLANNIWEDYVIEMDRQRQSEDLVEATGLAEVQTSYSAMFESLRRKLSENQSGRLGGGQWSQPSGIRWMPLLMI